MSFQPSDLAEAAPRIEFGTLSHDLMPWTGFVLRLILVPSNRGEGLLRK